jgi:creatinine amidohydrolase/Fe(II)-dependent formamide hydrolase-like protein
LSRRLLGCRALVAWPVLRCGYCPVFVDYRGSISLARDSFVHGTREILRGIAYAGARREAVLSTGISTRERLREAAAALRVPWRVIGGYAGPRFAVAQAATARWAPGGHADEIETALMRATAPRQVRLADVRPPAAPVRAGLFNRAGPDGPNYCPDGVNGDPRAATAAQGRRPWRALPADVQAELDGLEGSL